MNDELKDLQALWQGQETNPEDVSSLIKGLNTVERKSKRDRILLIITFPLTTLSLLALATILPAYMLTPYLLGIGMIVLAMAMILFLTFKTKFQPVHEGENLNNQDFLTVHIQKLKGRKLITSRYMWIYTILLVSGINIGYLGVLQEAGTTFRIVAHLGVTLALIPASWIGIRRRMKKYEEEIDPLIEKLEEMKGEGAQ